MSEVYQFELGNRVYTVDTADLEVDPENLVEEFVEQASRLVYAATLAARADACVRHAKMMLDEAQARADKRVRELIEQIGRKATEGAVAAEVTIDPDVMSAKRHLLKCQEDYGLLKAVEDAFKMRADMLVQLGVRARVEMENLNREIHDKPIRGAEMREAVKRARAKQEED